MTLTENYNGLEIDIEYMGDCFEVQKIVESTLNAEIEILNADIEATEEVDKKLIRECEITSKNTLGDVVIDIEYWVSLDYKIKTEILNKIFFENKDMVRDCNEYLSEKTGEYLTAWDEHLADLDERTKMENY